MTIPERAAACDACVARAWLLARLAGHLDLARGQLEETLALSDDELIAAIGGRRREAIAAEYEQLEIGEQRRRCDAAGIETVCRCDRNYPKRLLELTSPPAVLHVAGGLARLPALLSGQPVAIVGTRRPSGYGGEIAAALARGLASAGVTVLSGMALGIDSAAHSGALAAGKATLAVLPGGAERPYPPGKRVLHRRIIATGAAISELPPGVGVRRWMFPARNRLIAGLAAMTVVVEASEGSGALITATIAERLGRALGAVPGRVTSPQAAGPHRLLATGAALIAGPQDVLDVLFGADAPELQPRSDRPALEPELEALLAALADGHEPAPALAIAGFGPGDGLAALSSLELAGYVRRQPGGRFSVVP
jgi:DNA processing protein